MSSSFVSFGGAPTSFCQCCRNPLPQNSLQCEYCGYDNSSVQAFFPPAPLPSNAISSAFIAPPQTPEISLSIPEQRRTLNMKKVVGLIIVLLMLIGGSIAGWTLLVLRQTAVHTTTVSTSYPIPKATPLFAETFMTNSKQWNTQSMQGRYLVSMKKGNLLLEDDDNRIFPVILPSSKPFGNYKLIVNAELSKGDRQNGYGLCIRGTTDAQGNLLAYYRIEFYGNGTYMIFKVATDASGNTSSTTLVGATAHAAIQSVGHVNQVVVIANGSKMTLIVNGQMVRTFSDASYTSGVIALFVSNLPGTHPGAQATFSHLAIYTVNAK